MLRKLKIWQKLVLIAVFMGIPIPIVSYLLYNEKSKVKIFAEAEIYGLQYIRATMPLLKALQEHRNISAVYARGDHSVGEQLAKQKLVVDEALLNLESQDHAAVGNQTYGGFLRASQSLVAIRGKWEDMKRGSLSYSTQQTIDAHTALTTDLTDLIQHVGDTSNLILDPDLDTYYLMDSVVLQVPKLSENMSKSRVYAQGVLSAGAKTVDDDKQISLLNGGTTENIKSIRNGMKVGAAYNPELAQETAPQSENVTRLSEVMLAQMDARVLRAEKIDAEAGTRELQNASTTAMDQLYKYDSMAMSELERLLHVRIKGVVWSQIWVLALVLAGLLLTIAVVWLIVRSITKPLQSALRMANDLAKGDLSAHVEVRTEDEMGQLLHAMNEVTGYLTEMADTSDSIAGGNLKVDLKPRSAHDRFGNSFKNMLGRTLSLVQSQDERNEMQKAIMTLLSEVSDVAMGDLTVQAEVRPDMTGAIADAFNYMILELRSVINKVKDTTLQVSSSASEIQATTEHLAEGSGEQALQISNTSAAIEEMAASINQVSENAALSAAVADKSLMNARQGAEAVHSNIRAMGRIRDQVQETAKRVKRLGERSQEIGEIVGLIDDIADRTSMLALNASIQAAMAGEAGRGFAVVAEEVERLAERSTNATKQIASLTKTIQSETNEVVAAMEDTTREVVEGSTLANNAGQALTSIQDVSQQLSELIQSISQASNQQARGSEALAKSMIGISEVTNQVASGSRQAAVSVRSLVTLADALRGSVVTFKLPENGKN